MTARCLECQHTSSHNLFGKCRTPACRCRDYVPESTQGPVDPAPEGHTQVFRDPATNAPVAVPDEYIAAAERPYRAYKAHAGGMDWEEIAYLEKWPSAEAVAEAVKLYLREGRAIVGEFRRQEAIAMELGGLNMQMRSIWTKAMAGDIPANATALNIRRLRSQILGLLDREPGDSRDGGDPIPTTVVVGYNSYARDLRAITGETQTHWEDVIWDDDDPEGEPYLGVGATV